MVAAPPSRTGADVQLGAALSGSQSHLLGATAVAQLVATQFPQWAQLPVRAVQPQGWSNQTFRLGSDMVVRVPRNEHYVAQIQTECEFLPRLSGHLPVASPQPLAIGQPTRECRRPWVVYAWIEGETVQLLPTADTAQLAPDLGAFLSAMQRLDPTGGPQPGKHNFHRGGQLSIYNAQTRQALGILQGKLDTAAALRIWEAALDTQWSNMPVWVHGDIGVGNLLQQNGRLCGVIDFGNMCVGDPACDLAPAWTLFSGIGRAAFRAALAVDAGTWARGRAWVLWKALILEAGLVQSNAAEASNPRAIIEAVVSDGLCEGISGCLLRSLSNGY